jgi:hypothetical protein
MLIVDTRLRKRNAFKKVTWRPCFLPFIQIFLNFVLYFSGKKSYDGQRGEGRSKDSKKRERRSVPDYGPQG